MQKSVVLTTGNSNDDTCMYVSEPVQTYMTMYIFRNFSEKNKMLIFGKLEDLNASEA